MDRVTLAPVADVATLFGMYVDVRGRELELTDRPREQRDRLLAWQFEAQRRGYREQFPAAERRFIMWDGVAVGWIIVDRSGAEICCVDIALVERARGLGIGSHVLRGLQHEASTAGKPLTITVRRANIGAFTLYQRLGFRVIAQTDLHARLEWRA